MMHGVQTTNWRDGKIHFRMPCIILALCIEFPGVEHCELWQSIALEASSYRCTCCHPGQFLFRNEVESELHFDIPMLYCAVLLFLEKAPFQELVIVTKTSIFLNMQLFISKAKLHVGQATRYCQGYFGGRNLVWANSGYDQLKNQFQTFLPVCFFMLFIFCSKTSMSIQFWATRNVLWQAQENIYNKKTFTACLPHVYTVCASFLWGFLSHPLRLIVWCPIKLRTNLPLSAAVNAKKIHPKWTSKFVWKPSAEVLLLRRPTQWITFHMQWEYIKNASIFCMSLLGF